MFKKSDWTRCQKGGATLDGYCKNSKKPERRAIERNEKAVRTWTACTGYIQIAFLLPYAEPQSC